ncbi:hypothetical protein RB10607 [Rhodopirellula baltica SH 1]|uniref:Uncharacterized protein n=1 Tax=Rhodopirellula baltica (strain DSM 10527 / NCIMB 13988 / SH1) TaxID=243090 RepID=Q7UER4_RHOBA|nr:hypothetical protein RB10607 [Rhodopirellula baltica SH 1]
MIWTGIVHAKMAPYWEKKPLCANHVPKVQFVKNLAQSKCHSASAPSYERGLLRSHPFPFAPEGAVVRDDLRVRPSSPQPYRPVDLILTRSVSEGSRAIATSLWIPRSRVGFQTRVNQQAGSLSIQKAIQ